MRWLAALLMLELGSSALAQAPAEDPSVLPDGPARDDVFYLCTGCHGTALVRAQAMSRGRWDETLTWMTERHGMVPLDGEQRAQVLDYLTRHFGPDGQGGGKRPPFLVLPARKNPFAPS